jgi:hypothetical protein
MKSFISVIARSRLSLLGAVIATIAVVLFVILLGMEMMGHEGGPYLGILSYLVLPLMVVVGLVLIPIGIWQLKTRDARGEAEPPLPVIDFNKPQTRRSLQCTDC